MRLAAAHPLSSSPPTNQLHVDPIFAIDDERTRRYFFVHRASSPAGSLPADEVFTAGRRADKLFPLSHIGVEIMDKEKSRRDKRKEARVAKRNQRHLSWMQHQKTTSHGEKTCDHVKPLDSKKRNGQCTKPSSINDGEHMTPKELEQKLSPMKPCSGQQSLGRKVKTKFEEYLEMDMHRGLVSTEEDLELERKLAKKLKVMKGKLQGIDDGMNFIFDGISSVFDSISDDELLEVGKKRKDVSGKKRSKKRSLADDSGKVQDGVMGGISMEDVDPFLGLVTDDELISTNEQQESVVRDLSLRKKSRRKRKEQTHWVKETRRVM